MSGSRTIFRGAWGAVVCGSVLAAACSSSSSAPRAGDAGIDARVEAGKDGSPAVDAGIGIVCAKLLTCDQACTSTSCTNACYAEATGHAQGIFDAFTKCLADNCPATDGGACASSSSSECSSCNQSAAIGACASLLLACEGDKQVGPPDPDGGSAEYDSGATVDSGPRTSCGALLGCETVCKTGDTACITSCFNQGTSTAQALDEALDNCVALACPTTDGGACASMGTTCTGCQSEADFGSCAAQFSACQDDKSASPDGGTEPVALHGGTIDTLATGLDQPQVVIVQGGAVFSSEVTATGAVFDVGLDGGVPATISASQPYPMGLALDTANIYVWNSGTFTSGGTLNNGDGTVVQLPLGGGAPTTLATKMTVAFTAPYLNAIASDAAHVYFVTGGPGTAGAINVAPIGGGSAESVLYGSQSFPQAVVTDATNLYWANWGTFDSSGDYNNDGAVIMAPKAGGGTPVTLASKQSAPAALAIDATNVYWTNIGQLTASGLPKPGTGSVAQVPIAGGSTVTLAKDVDIALGIAVSGSTVYFTQYALSSPGAIESVPVGGGTVTTLVANVDDPFGLTVAAGVIYWSDNIPTGAKTGAILSLTP